MKRFICLGLVFASVSGLLTAYGFETVPDVYVDYKKMDFPVEPEIIDGEVYVPVRNVLEAYLNREPSFKSTSSGKLLILETPDGRFSLNIDNGAYSYVIDNKNYGVVSLFDDTSEDKMGILSQTPFIKEGYTMAPVKELIEILDGNVYYDEDINQISIISNAYLENIGYVGEPFPVVYVFSDMDDIYQIEKISDIKGYEELAELCIEQYGDNPDYSKYDEFEELDLDSDTSGSSSYFEYYGSAHADEDETEKEISKLLFEGLYENADNPLITGVIKNFISGDYSEVITVDDELTMEESLDSCVAYLYETILDDESAETISVSSEYLEFAKYVSDLTDLMVQITDMINNYKNYSEEDYTKFSESAYYYQLLDDYIYAIYDEAVTDYLEMAVEDYYQTYIENS